MKKVTLIIFGFLCSTLSFSQLALQDFEGTTFPPTNWAIFDNGIGGTPNLNWVSFTTSCFGAKAAYMNRQNIGQGNTSQDFLVTPAVLIPSNGELKFSTRSFTPGDLGTKYQIWVKPVLSGAQNAITGYTLFQQWDENNISNTCEEKTVNLSTLYSGQNVYIAFVMEFTQTSVGISGDRWLIDNVRVVENCLPPTSLPTTPVLATSATLHWTNTTGAPGFEIENILGTGTPTGIATGTSTTNSFVQTGLIGLTNYCYFVRALCASGETSVWAGPFCYTTTAAPPVCGGNFVDSGGSTGNYSDGENTTTTICPTIAGQQVTVAFTSFSTESCCDRLTIYDGNSTASPVLGVYAGATIPPTFTASSASGCLTFVFTSDSSVTSSGWNSNVTCAPAPTCPKPTNLAATALLSNSANLSWTNNSSATSFQVLALPCTSPAPTSTSTGWVTTSLNPFVITGLTPSTCYNFYVRAYCSATDISLWSILSTGTTQALPPVCGGNFVDSGGSTGNYSDGENITTTICPTIASQQVTVAFTSFSTEGCCDRLTIYDGNSTASTVLGVYAGTTIPPTFTASSASGCLTFVFTSDGSVTSSGWNSDVTCAPAPTCPKPTDLAATALLSNSANLSWTNNSSATSFQVLALPCTSPAPTATSTGWVTTSLNPFVISGLNPTTCYNFYVRAYCSATDISLWSSFATGTTQALPPICGGNFVDSGGSTGNYQDGENITTTICPTIPGQLVTVSFNSFSTEGCCDNLTIYDGNSSSAPILGIFAGNAIPPTFTSSSPDGCLTFVFTSDSSVTSSGWNSDITCGPAPLCRKPVNLTASTLTYNSLSLGWTNVGAATSWQVLYLPCGSPVPTATTTGWTVATTNSLQINGLTANTCYDFYVRGDCTTDGVSLWSVPLSITTQIAPPVCGGNYLDSGILDNYTDNSNLATLICPSTPGDKVTISFTSFETEEVNDVLNIYNGNSASAPLIGSYSGTNLPPSITSSAVNGCLYFVFISNGSINLSGWSSNITCAPAVSCPKPLGLTASAVITNTSQLSWIEAGSANTWQILTLPCGSPAPTATSTGWIATSATTFTVNGLSPGCCNDYYIRSVCSASQTSDWSIAYQNLNGSFITWSSVSGSNSVSGTFPGGTVTATLTGLGNAVSFGSPAGNTINLPATGSNTFDTFGPTTNPPSQSITYTFSTPVIISQYSMADIDLGGSWNDSFNFGGVVFSSTTATNLSTTVTGAVATTDTAGNGEFGSWYMSTTPVTSFSLNFLTTGGLTHAYLAYAMKVFIPCPPTISNNPIVTVNSTNACIGLLATVTATPTVSGSYTYAWTVPAGVTQPANTVASFSTNVPGVYSVIITNTVTGLSSASASGTVSFSSTIIPNFNIATTICTGSVAPNLPTTSTNLINGTWTPTTISNTTSGTYTFNPATNQCATPFVLNIVVTPQITPIFNPIAPICQGSTAPILPVVSNNGMTGTWTPSVINMSVIGSSSYTFTPIQNQPCTVLPVSINVIINAAPIAPTVINLTQPTCAIQSGSIQVTNPLNTTVNVSNLFISEVTDEETGSLTYVEIYNATGSSKNLVNYKLKVYNNGNTTASCDLILSGTIANNTTNVIKLSNDPNISGIIPNQSFITCGGININDNIKLTTSADVVIDNWGRSDGVNYTPNFQTGYTYRRHSNAPLPSTTWNPSDWDALDPQDYSNIGSYTFLNNQYFYNINGGTYQSNPIFGSLIPGSYTVTVQNASTGCISAGTVISVAPIPTFPPVTTISYPTPICRSIGATLSPSAPVSGFTSGGTYTSSSTNLVVNSSSGVIDLINSVAGTYTITYSVLANASTCQLAGSFPFTITINQPIANTFAPVLPICNGDILSALPLISNEGISGTWSPNLNNTATQTYTFTPDIGQCGNQATLTIIVNQKTTPTFATIGTICSGTVAPVLVQTSINNITGTWFPALINNNTSGNYVFTPNLGQCANPTTVAVTITPANIVPDFATSLSFCYGTTAPILGLISPNGISGTWLPNVISNTASGSYIFTPNPGQCAVNKTVTVTITAPYIIPNFSTNMDICIGATIPTLSGTSPNNITGTWTPPNVNNNQSGSYVFTPNIGQCAVNTTLLVSVENAIDFEIIGGCIENDYFLNVSPIGNSYNPNNVSYSWQYNSMNVGSNNPEFNVTSYVNSTTVSETLPMIVYVAVTTPLGCVLTKPFQIDKLYCSIQRGISPNGDSSNEYFDLELLDVKYLSIYNRYGMKVYSKSDYKKEWVGQTDDGTLLPDATYYYVIDFNNNSASKTGWIYINREIK